MCSTVSAEVVRFKRASDDSHLLCTVIDGTEEIVLRDFDTIRFDEIRLYIFSSQTEMYFTIQAYASRNETTGVFLNELYHENFTIQRDELLTVETLELKQNTEGEYIILSYKNVNFIFYHQTALAALLAGVQTQGDFFIFVLGQVLIASITVFTASFFSKKIVIRAKHVPAPSQTTLIVLFIVAGIAIGASWTYALDLFIQNILYVHVFVFAFTILASLNMHNPELKEILFTKLMVEKEGLRQKDEKFKAIDENTPILDGVIPALYRIAGRQAKLKFDTERVWYIKSDAFAAVYLAKSWEKQGNSIVVELAEAHHQRVQEFLHGYLSALDMTKAYDEVQMQNYELQATLHSTAMDMGGKYAVTVVKGLIGYEKKDKSPEEAVSEEVEETGKSSET